MEVKLFFPNMPSEVFEQFIQPQLQFDIESLTVLETFVTAPGWAKYFRNKPLKFWASLTWTKLSIPYRDVHINPETINLACQLAKEFRESCPSQTAERANIQDSKARFDACASFIKSMGKFPKPLVCLDVGSHFDLLDGYHRLAALFSTNDYENFPVDVWVGKAIP